jgi:hypothetical protein
MFYFYLGGTMKFLFGFIILLVILSGCQSRSTNLLDTSKLEAVEDTRNEEQVKELPITYKARTIEEGIKALPFDIKLPEVLPTEIGPFQPPSIEDFKRDGRLIKVSFFAFSENPQERSLLMVAAHNFKVEYGGSAEQVELYKGLKGGFSGNTLSFVKSGIYYDITYTRDTIEKERHKEILIGLANQMLQ